MAGLDIMHSAMIYYKWMVAKGNSNGLGKKKYKFSC